MKRNVLLLVLTAFPIFVFAQINTWVGPASGSWTLAANWSLGTVPVSANDVQFDGALVPTTTISDFPIGTPFFKKLIVKNGATVNLSAVSNTVVGVDNGLQIDATSQLNIGGTTATKFVIQVATTTGTSAIAGILDLKGTGNSSNFTGYDPYFSFSTLPITTVTGKIILSGPNAKISNSNSTNLVFESGSSLEFRRDGGQTPAANYKNGSLILIAGVVGSVTGLNSSCIYNGVIEWNAPAQTTSASAASLALSSSYSIDSFIVKNTGALGTVRFTTEMSSSPNIQFVRVEGGTLEFASPRANYRTFQIGSHLEVAGGTCLINAADGTDGSLNYALTVTVNGNVSVSGGILNLSNRSSGTTVADGAGQLIVKGNFIQTGGLITETATSNSAAYPNYLDLKGTSLQQLALTNWNNQIVLYLSNKTNGVLLQSTIACPYKLQLNDSSFTLLNPYHVQVQNANFSFTGLGRLVTNGTGHLSLSNFQAGVTSPFPVTPTLTSLSTVLLQNTGVVNTFDIRVERGINPPGIFNTGATVNRTWIINDSITGPNNSVALYFSYPDTVLNGGAATRSTPKELGHFIAPAWNVDPNGITQIPINGGASPATDIAGFYAPIGLDSAFVLGEQGAILAIGGFSIDLIKGEPRSDGNLITWKSSCNLGAAIQFTLEKSSRANGPFSTFSQSSVDANQCSVTFTTMDIQPFTTGTYYRIKGKGSNGQFAYSRVVYVSSGKSIQLMPTLVTNNLTLTIPAEKNGECLITIFDGTGRSVKQITQKCIMGNNSFTIFCNNLPPGTYYLSAVTADEQLETKRFIKL